MLKGISFKKLAVLSAGIAIVLSACGLQNTAGESSGAETAAGKTKNSALNFVSEWCQILDGNPIDIDALVGDTGLTIRKWANAAAETDISKNRYSWADKENRISILDTYGPTIVKCDSIEVVSAAEVASATAGVTSAEELPKKVVENSTANQCISIENRKKTLRGYDDQIMAHSLDADKTIFDRMKYGRWITTVQRPCDESVEINPFSELACVSVSHKAFEAAFYTEQYELHKDEAGTPYLDLMIIGKDRANKLITC